MYDERIGNKKISKDFAGGFNIEEHFVYHHSEETKHIKFTRAEALQFAQLIMRDEQAAIEAEYKQKTADLWKSFNRTVKDEDEE